MSYDQNIYQGFNESIRKPLFFDELSIGEDSR
jgi:hypothetical protein